MILLPHCCLSGHLHSPMDCFWNSCVSSHSLSPPILGDLSSGLPWMNSDPDPHPPTATMSTLHMPLCTRFLEGKGDVETPRGEISDFLAHLSAVTKCHQAAWISGWLEPVLALSDFRQDTPSGSGGETHRTYRASCLRPCRLPWRQLASSLFSGVFPFIPSARSSLIYQHIFIEHLFYVRPWALAVHRYIHSSM